MKIELYEFSLNLYPENQADYLVLDMLHKQATNYKMPHDAPQQWGTESFTLRFERLDIPGKQIKWLLR